MHAIWTLPEGDADFPRADGRPSRWRSPKRVARGEALSASRRRRGERGIWQRRYWEHTIRNDRDYATHMDYIHFNPVKHGPVTEVAAWPFSSFHKSVAMGLYPRAGTGKPMRRMIGASGVETQADRS